MKCQHCGYETNSNKILIIHEKNCRSNQEDNKMDANDPEKMEWNQLKKYAASKGISTAKASKEDILKALKELDEQN